MVYIDSMEIKYKGMIMCHMIADTDDELIAFAKSIGLKEVYWQYKGTYKSHFDISKSKKELALKNGAQLIDRRMLVKILNKKKQEIKKDS